MSALRNAFGPARTQSAARSAESAHLRHAPRDAGGLRVVECALCGARRRRRPRSPRRRSGGITRGLLRRAEPPLQPAHGEAGPALPRPARVKQIEERVPRGRCSTSAADAGLLPAFMRERGWDAHGLEISETAAHHARDVLGVPVFIGSLPESPYPAGHVRRGRRVARARAHGRSARGAPEGARDPAPRRAPDGRGAELREPAGGASRAPLVPPRRAAALPPLPPRGAEAAPRGDGLPHPHGAALLPRAEPVRLDPVDPEPARLRAEPPLRSAEAARRALGQPLRPPPAPDAAMLARCPSSCPSRSRSSSSRRCSGAAARSRCTRRATSEAAPAVTAAAPRAAAAAQQARRQEARAGSVSRESRRGAASTSAPRSAGISGRPEDLERTRARSRARVSAEPSPRARTSSTFTPSTGAAQAPFPRGRTGGGPVASTRSAARQRMTNGSLGSEVSRSASRTATKGSRRADADAAAARRGRRVRIELTQEGPGRLPEEERPGSAARGTLAGRAAQELDARCGVFERGFRRTAWSPRARVSAARHGASGVARHARRPSTVSAASPPLTGESRVPCAVSEGAFPGRAERVEDAVRRDPRAGVPARPRRADARLRALEDAPSQASRNAPQPLRDRSQVGRLEAEEREVLRRASRAGSERTSG